MHFLIVSKDENFGSLLGTMLRPSGIQSSAVTSMGEALSALSKNSFDLLLVDLPPQLNDSANLLSVLRQGSNPTTPVVLCSELHHESSADLKKLMLDFSVKVYMPRPFDMFDAPKVLIEASTRKAKPQAAERRISRKALRSISNLWREGSTGVLRLEGRDDWAVICGGGPNNPDGLMLISEALHSNAFNFTPTDIGGKGDQDGLARLLWNGAVSLIGEYHYLKLATSGIFTTHDLFSSPLPFSGDTLKLLSNCTGKTRFKEQCHNMRLNQAKVGREVGALALMSVVELNDLGPEEIVVTRPRFSKTKPRVDADSPKQKPVPVVPVRKPNEETSTGGSSKMLSFLLADLKRLKGQDNFTILGISPKCTQAIAEEAGARNISRYQEILRGEISTEIRAAAQQMLTIVTAAAATVASARQGVSDQPEASDMSNMTTEERAFTQGKKAFNNRDYTLARKCFKRARDERLDSVDNLAWLGWAVYHDKDIEKEDRVKEAFDMLRLASSFNPHHEDGQYFLAYVEGHHGLMKQALQRLTGLLGDNPNNQSAKNLAREYRKMLKQ